MRVVRKVLSLCAFLGAAGMMVGANAADMAKPGQKMEAAKDLVLKGDAKCTGCHDESDEPQPSMLDLHPGVLRIGKTKHGTQADKRTPSCTNCHGESDKHRTHKGKEKPPKPDRVFIKGPFQSSAEVRNEACTSCHKGGKRMFWESGAHASNDVACASCHNIHADKDKVRDKRTQSEVCFSCHKQQRAESLKPSRHPIPEGKMACSDCHNTHGATGEKLLTKQTVNATCYSCHAEKRGPFVRNHAPVQENCAICHNPHGTTTQAMLKVRAPFLCQECHEDASHRGNMPAATRGSITGETGKGVILGQGCVTCHVAIHGSNNPQDNSSFRH